MQKPDPPADRQAEQRLLGSLLLSPAQVDGLLAEVAPQDFFFPDLRNVFVAISDLAMGNKPITVATVSQQAKIDQAQVAPCLDGAMAGEALFWAEQVVAVRRRRTLVEVGSLALDLATGDGDIDVAYRRVEAALAEDTQQADVFVSVESAVERLLAQYQDYIDHPGMLRGTPTTWRYLDWALDGLMPGAVTLVYGPTSQYKSSFVQNLIWLLISNEVPSLAFTTEMPAKQVTERLLQLQLGLNIRTLRQEKSFKDYLGDITEAGRDIASFPLVINDRSVLDVSFLKGAVMRAAKSLGTKVVFVDLVDHVVSHRLKEGTTVSESYIMQTLKDTAKQAQVHIVVTSHITKLDRDTRSLKRPVISLDEAKGSSSKTQDADNCISLVVCEYDPFDGGKWTAADREARERMQAEGKVYLMAGITKNRDGPLVDIPFYVSIEEGMRMTPWRKD